MEPIAEILRRPSARPGPGHQVSERAELADFTPENDPLSAISGRFSGFFLYESETLRGPTPSGWGSVAGLGFGVQLQTKRTHHLQDRVEARASLTG